MSWFKGVLAHGAKRVLLPDYSNPLVVTTATLTLVPATHAGRVLHLNKADGIVVTLPAATGSGQRYPIFAKTAVSSNGYIIKATGNDIFVGQVSISLAAGGGDFAESAGGTDDTLTMNGTTSGGLAGSFCEFTDIDLDTWLLDARLLGSGTLATTGLLTATVS